MVNDPQLTVPKDDMDQTMFNVIIGHDLALVVERDPSTVV